jgi:hypothetical protein
VDFRAANFRDSFLENAIWPLEGLKLMERGWFRGKNGVQHAKGKEVCPERYLTDAD